MEFSFIFVYKTSYNIIFITLVTYVTVAMSRNRVKNRLHLQNKRNTKCLKNNKLNIHCGRFGMRARCTVKRLTLTMRSIFFLKIQTWKLVITFLISSYREKIYYLHFISIVKKFLSTTPSICDISYYN